MSLLKMGKFPISHIMQKFEGSVNLFRNLIFSFRTQCKNIRGLRTHFTHSFPQFAHCAKTERVCAKPNSHAPKPKGLSEFLFKSLLSPISKAPSHCESLYHLATSSLHSVASSLSYSTHHPPLPPGASHFSVISFPHSPISPFPYGADPRSSYCSFDDSHCEAESLLFLRCSPFAISGHRGPVDSTF